MPVVTRRRLVLRWALPLTIAWIFGLALLIGGNRWYAGHSAQQRMQDIAPLIVENATLFNLDPLLVAAVIMVESAAKPDAISSANAIGLMQVRRIAEEEVHRKHDLPNGDLRQPRYNIMIGCAYLADCGKRFSNQHGTDWVLALAAYNAGPTRMAKLRKQHPTLPTKELIDRHAPQETKGYYRKVIRWYQHFQQTQPFTTKAASATSGN